MPMLDFLVESIVTLLMPAEWLVSLVARYLLVPLLQLVF